MERPRSAAAARQEVKTRTHKMLLESGIPALLEKLLADCFMSCPARPLEFLATALENHAAGRSGEVSGASPVADRPTTPAGLKEKFDQSARECAASHVCPAPSAHALLNGSRVACCQGALNRVRVAHERSSKGQAGEPD
jgi:hypothetical protein